jgi:hypothetical protein
MAPEGSTGKARAVLAVEDGIVREPGRRDGGIGRVPPGFATKPGPLGEVVVTGHEYSPGSWALADPIERTIRECLSGSAFRRKDAIPSFLDAIGSE